MLHEPREEERTPTRRLEVDGIREGFPGDAELNLEGETGINQAGMWTERKGKDGIPDRECSMCEDRAVGERTVIRVLQLVQYSIGSRVWTLTLECLVLPLSGCVMGKLLDFSGLYFSFPITK